MRSDDVIPFAMKRSAAKVDPSHLVVRDFSASGILASIQSTADRQAFGRRRLGDQLDDGFVIPQGFATPVRGDERKEAVLDLVPLTGPGRKMTDLKAKPRVISEVLQLQFPEAQPPDAATT